MNNGELFRFYNTDILSFGLLGIVNLGHGVLISGYT